MKKKLSVIIVGIIGFICILFGVITIFFNSESKKEETKKLRKITEEEISHEVAHEIVEFYASKEEELKDEKIIKAILVASDEKGEYLIRVEFESNPGEWKETTMNYLGDGEWKINFPLGETTDYSDKYTMFWPETIDDEDIELEDNLD